VLSDFRHRRREYNLIRDSASSPGGVCIGANIKLPETSVEVSANNSISFLIYSLPVIYTREHEPMRQKEN
jgi:hypothetical protein